MLRFLDYLIAPYHIHWVRELINFVLVVGGIFLLGMSLLFSQALQLEREHMFADAATGEKYQDVLGIVANTTSQSITGKPSVASHTKIVLEDFEHIVGGSEKNFYDYDLATHLETKLPTYTLAFNTIVPDNRLMIPSLDIDTPIVDVPYASEKKLLDADFDEELMAGVVRYPFTALPGDVGNSLLFGHSSVDGRERKNPYGFVFYKLPKINIGEDIHIVREGKLHTYSVENKTVKNPDEVSDELITYKDDTYLTLMACYPLFSDARRMLVRAKYKDNTSSHALAAHTTTVPN